jgi:SSS family solute:Na+ symporter
MSLTDWLIVILLNGPIIVYGLVRSRETKTSADWFLAGRSLPWWMIGLSLYATAIDSSDLVADAGGVYTLGMSFFVINWVGVVIGWVVAAQFVFLPMYRLGMYTNAEYLEVRFGPWARVISVLVQVQYRTLVLGIIAYTLYLVLRIVCAWPSHVCWWAVALIALISAIYTALGGLKSVAITDALQSVVMVVAAVVLFLVVWNNVGGWAGLEAKMETADPDLAEQMLRIGHETVKTEVSATVLARLSPEQIESRLLVGGHYDEDRGVIERRTPAWLVSVAFLIVGLSYSIVNHTQSMRMFAARSEWDLKMSVVVACAILLVTAFANLMIGIMGRAIYPDPTAMAGLDEALQKPDAIYPLLISQLDLFAFKGVVVAGILAAAFSTFDSIGSTLSSLLVRDVYARLMVTDQDDHHYMRVGQWLTPLIIFGSFAYVPFLQQGMVLFYLDVVGAFVVPLLTIYLMGVSTRVHRTSGTVALLVGAAYGVLRLLAPTVAQEYGIAVLPPIMVDNFASYPLSMAITAGTMVVFSMVAGWQPSGDLLHVEEGGWLRASQQQVQAIETTQMRPRSDAIPILLSLAVIGIGLVLSFVVFW